MATTIYLVRHGQTLFNFEHRIQGSSDSRLTKLGIKQVKALRDYFNKHNITFNKAYCSTQERASDTLEILTGNELQYTRIGEIKERDYGFFEGQKDFLWSFRHFPVEPKVESTREVVERMERGMNLILRDAQDNDVILVVGHSDSMGQYLKQVANVKKFKGFDNASYVKMISDGQMMEYVESGWPAENVRINLDGESI